MPDFKVASPTPHNTPVSTPISTPYSGRIADSILEEQFYKQFNVMAIFPIEPDVERPRSNAASSCLASPRGVDKFLPRIFPKQYPALAAQYVPSDRKPLDVIHTGEDDHISLLSIPDFGDAAPVAAPLAETWPDAGSVHAPWESLSPASDTLEPVDKEEKFDDSILIPDHLPFTEIFHLIKHFEPSKHSLLTDFEKAVVDLFLGGQLNEKICQVGERDMNALDLADYLGHDALVTLLRKHGASRIEVNRP